MNGEWGLHWVREKSVVPAYEEKSSLAQFYQALLLLYYQDEAYQQISSSSATCNSYASFVS